jgi:hypothetical protein
MTDEVFVSEEEEDAPPIPPGIENGDYTSGRLAGLFNRCNAQVTQVQNHLNFIQMFYTKTHEAMWQGLCSHSAPVVHGAAVPGNPGGEDVTPDATGRKPSDRTEDWDDVFPGIKQPLPFTVTVDDYRSPKGFGFVTHYDFTIDGDQYRRSIDNLLDIHYVPAPPPPNPNDPTPPPAEKLSWMTKDTNWKYVEPASS